MKYRDAIILSLRAFRTNTSRTLLTILGVSIGIAAVLFLVSLGYGLQNVILNRITTADTLLTLDVSSPDSSLLPLNREQGENISNIEGVDEISPVVQVRGQLVSGAAAADGSFYLVDRPFFRLGGLSLLTGRSFASGDSKEIVISSAAVELLGFSTTEEIIGQKFEVDLFLESNEDVLSDENQVTEYEVVGVFDDKTANTIYLPIFSLSGLELPSYSSFKVKVADSERLGPVREELINKGYFVSALSDTIEQTKKIFQIIQIVLGIFGLIALTVSAIGMFNTMTITLLERTQEIGIMRSIGVGTRDVAKLFLFESIIIGLMGGFGGIFIGYLAGFSFNLFINILSRNFGGTSLDIFYCPPWFLIFILSFSLLTGLLTGLYPARRAARLNPLDALRYK